jgi:hypothetical protein
MLYIDVHRISFFLTLFFAFLDRSTVHTHTQVKMYGLVPTGKGVGVGFVFNFHTLARYMTHMKMLKRCLNATER